jgi:hypothetical protein
MEPKNAERRAAVPTEHAQQAPHGAGTQAAYDRLRRDDVKILHYISGADLLGDDSEGTVDSSHPTDLGFMRQAEAFAKVLRPILSR